MSGEEVLNLFASLQLWATNNPDVLLAAAGVIGVAGVAIYAWIKTRPSETHELSSLNASEDPFDGSEHAQQELVSEAGHPDEPEEAEDRIARLNPGDTLPFMDNIVFVFQEHLEETDEYHEMLSGNARITLPVGAQILTFDRKIGGDYATQDTAVCILYELEGKIQSFTRVWGKEPPTYDEVRMEVEEFEIVFG